MAHIYLSGGNRGIGYELCKQLQQSGHTVVTGVRQSSEQLDRLGVDVITGIDLAQPDSLPRLQSALGTRVFDMLISNAGVLLRETAGALDFEQISYQFTVNALAPLRLVHGLAERLSDGAKVGIITSRVGSIGDNQTGGLYGYRMSKAAANMMGVNLSHELGQRGIAVALLHPGLVATEMTGGQGIEPALAANGIIERMHALEMRTSGRFWHAEGHELPW